MATIFYRRKSRKVYIYYTDPKDKKLKQVERKLTKHLDGQPIKVVEAWRDEWEKKHGISRDRVNRSTLKKDDRLMKQWKRYQDFKAADKQDGRRKRTIEAETNLFLNHIVAYFVNIHEKKDPKTWHELVPDFHLHLDENKLGAASRRAILWTLKRFGDSLVFSHYMNFSYVIRPPHSKNEKQTPLKVEKTPKEIIDFVKSAIWSSPKRRPTKNNPDGEIQIDFNLAILLGYFGGFGPGELFALEKGDFLTGSQAELASKKTLGGFREEGLGSRLAVIACKTLPHIGEPQPLMKNDYRFGVCNIWSVEAAKLISSIVRDKPEGRLFPFSYAYLMRRWREQVLPKLGVTAHDLRRASGLYLGRDLRIDLTLLQDHMRHAEVTTSILYTRAPAPKNEKRIKLNQDFDEVA
jgi:integrase